MMKNFIYMKACKGLLLSMNKFLTVTFILVAEIETLT